MAWFVKHDWFSVGPSLNGSVFGSQKLCLGTVLHLSMELSSHYRNALGNKVLEIANLLCTVKSIKSPFKTLHQVSVTLSKNLRSYCSFFTLNKITFLNFLKLSWIYIEFMLLTFDNFIDGWEKVYWIHCFIHSIRLLVAAKLKFIYKSNDFLTKSWHSHRGWSLGCNQWIISGTVGLRTFHNVIYLILLILLIILNDQLSCCITKRLSFSEVNKKSPRINKTNIWDVVLLKT